MAEVPNNDLEDKKLKAGEQSDSKLKSDIEKGGGDIQKGMKTIAQEEIDAIKKNFSADELKDPAYNGKFQTAQTDFEAKTDAILAGKGKPEEKIQALNDAFEAFKKQVASIKGTKEAEDAQRRAQNAENMGKDGEKNAKAGQEFKDTLLKSIQETREAGVQKEIKAARFLVNSEGEKSQVAANETLGRDVENLDWPGSLKA